MVSSTNPICAFSITVGLRRWLSGQECLIHKHGDQHPHQIWVCPHMLWRLCCGEQRQASMALTGWLASRFGERPSIKARRRATEGDTWTYWHCTITGNLSADVTVCTCENRFLAGRCHLVHRWKLILSHVFCHFSHSYALLRKPVQCNWYL